MYKERPENAPDMFCEQSHILPYGSNLSAPSIVVPDLDLFRVQQGSKAAKLFEAKFNELKKQYEELLKLANDTDMVYKAKYSFQPIVGHSYHLYTNEDGYFLSLIEPERWDKFEFIGSYLFTSDGVWEKQ